MNSGSKYQTSYDETGVPYVSDLTPDSWQAGLEARLRHLNGERESYGERGIATLILRLTGVMQSKWSLFQAEVGAYLSGLSLLVLIVLDSGPKVKDVVGGATI